MCMMVDPSLPSACMAQRGRAEWHIGSSARAFIYSICHKAYPTARALLCTSTRLLIQVATGTMDSLPALQADCSASWEVHDWACVRAACLLHPQERRRRASRYSPFACTLHAGYAKQVMHVSVPLPPEKVNSDALVLGSWQMHHIHTHI